MTALLWECVIVIIYWPIIFPTPENQKLLVGKPGEQVRNIFDHAVPIIVLWVEWSLNSIWIEWNQIYPNLLGILFYGFINMIVTAINGKPVYPPLSWDSFGAWALGLSILLVAYVFWIAIYYLTKCKFRKMQMLEQYTTTSSNVDSERPAMGTLELN